MVELSFSHQGKLMASKKKKQGNSNRHSCYAIPAVFLSNTYSWLVDNNLAWSTKERAMSCCWRAIVRSPLKLTEQLYISTVSNQDMRTWIFMNASVVFMPLWSHKSQVRPECSGKYDSSNHGYTECSRLSASVFVMVNEVTQTQCSSTVRWVRKGWTLLKTLQAFTQSGEHVWKHVVDSLNFHFV